MLDVSCETREANTGMRCDICVWHSVHRTPRVRAEERHRMRTSMQTSNEGNHKISKMREFRKKRTAAKTVKEGDP